MPIGQPRIPPLAPDQWTDEAREIFAIIEGEQARREGSKYNTILTIAHHPELALSYLPFNRRMLRSTTLSDRVREIIILRTAYWYAAAYILYQHRIIAGECGFSAAEIDATQTADGDAGWTPLERTVIDAVDELKSSGMISQANWDILARDFDKKQLLDIIYTFGNYAMYAMYLNNCGVEIER